MDGALKQVVRLAGDQRARTAVEVIEQHDAAGLRNAMRGQVLLENEVMVAAFMAQR
jgi:hypothetical protein